MAVIVTGATGFVGRRVVEALSSRGTPVRAVVHNPTNARVLAPWDVETVHADVLEPASLESAFHDAESVVHLVAVIREEGGRTFHGVNYEGTRNVVRAAASAGVGRIVLASTMGASSDAYLRYLYSRWMAEQEVLQERYPFLHRSLLDSLR